MTTYIDTETTVVDPTSARNRELELLTPESERMAQVNPGEPIPDKVVQLSGLTADDLAAIESSPPFEAVWKEIRGLVERPNVLIGHNLLRYDWPLLLAEITRAGMAVDVPVMIDTLVLAKHLLVRANTKKTLSAIAAHYGVPVPDDAHRAVADCRMTRGIMEAMKPSLPSDLEALLQLQAEAETLQAGDWQNYRYWLATSPDGLAMACGKFCGTLLVDVDPSYLGWLSRNVDDLPDKARTLFEEAAR